MSQLSNTELAYIAGIIDGEGCITINHARSKASWIGYSNMLQVKVAMTTYQVPYWLHKRCGGNLREHHPNDGRKVNHIWTICSRQAASLLDQLLPFLKNTKSQAEVAIKFQSTHTLGGYKSVEYWSVQESYRLKLQELKL